MRFRAPSAAAVRMASCSVATASLVRLTEFACSKPACTSASTYALRTATDAFGASASGFSSATARIAVGSAAEFCWLLRTLASTVMALASAMVVASDVSPSCCNCSSSCNASADAGPAAGIFPSVRIAFA